MHDMVLSRIETEVERAHDLYQIYSSAWPVMPLPFRIPKFSMNMLINSDWIMIIAYMFE